MIALIVNGLSTFGMMLILTRQLRSVMHCSALATGLAAAFGAPWLLAAVPAAALITATVPARRRAAT